MIAVWKFEIPYPDDSPHITMPEGAQVLHVGAQNERPTLWARVDTEAKYEDRVFQFRGTGHDVPNGHVYLGTSFIGPFVWHLFERHD